MRDMLPSAVRRDLLTNQPQSWFIGSHGVHSSVTDMWPQTIAVSNNVMKTSMTLLQSKHDRDPLCRKTYFDRLHSDIIYKVVKIST